MHRSYSEIRWLGQTLCQDAHVMHAQGTTTKKLKATYSSTRVQGTANRGAEASGTGIICSFQPSAAMLCHWCCGLPRGQQLGCWAVW